MNRSVKVLVAFFSVGLGLCVFSSSGWAQTVAGLEMEMGAGVDARLRGEILDATAAAFEASPKYTYIDGETVRGRLSSVVRGCFTAECLQQAGQTLDARLGLRVTMSGAAQIYDWRVMLYDLATGQPLNAKTGTCELCGRAEVVRNYSASMSALVQETQLPVLGSATAPAASPEGATPSEDELAALDEPRPPAEPIGEGPYRLRVSVVPAEAQIYFNDVLVGHGDVIVRMGEGTHEVRFVQEGYRGLRETVVVGETSPELIMLRTHLSQSAPAPTSGLPLREPGLVDRLEEHRAVVGWTSVSAGTVFLVSGMYLSAIHGSQVCETGSFSQCPEIYNTAAPGIFLTLTGTTLLTAGAGLLLWDIIAGPTPRKDEAPVRVAPAIGPGEAGLMLRGRF